MYDSFSNFLANLKFGYKSSLSFIITYNTIFIQTILLLLKRLGYIHSFLILNSRKIQIFLKYNEYNKPSMLNVQRVSKPGNRVYIPYKVLKNFEKNTHLNARSHVAVISTSKGILTTHSAQRLKVGGELLFLIS